MRKEKEELLIRALKNRGEIYDLLGLYDKSIDDYKSAICYCKSKFSMSQSKTADLQIYLADLLIRRKGNIKEARILINHALRKLDRIKNIEIFAHGYNILGIIDWHRGDYNNSLKNLKRTLCIYEKLNDKHGIIVILNNIGLIYQQKGESKTALKYLKRSFEISEELNNKRAICVSSINIGNAYSVTGELNLALKYFKKCLVVSEEIQFKKGISMAFSCIADYYFDRGEFDTSLKYYFRTLSLAKEIKSDMSIGRALNTIGLLYQNKGELKKAIRYFKEYLSISEKLNFQRAIGIATSNLGGIYVEKQITDKAYKYLSIAKKSFLKTGDKILLADVYATISELNILNRKYKIAISYGMKAYSIIKKLHIKEKLSFIFRVLGKSNISEDTRRAIYYLKKSIRFAREQKNIFEIALSLYELGKILKEDGKTKEAREYLIKSENLFKKTGAKLWLKKVKQLLS